MYCVRFIMIDSESTSVVKKVHTQGDNGAIDMEMTIIPKANLPNLVAEMINWESTTLSNSFRCTDLMGATAQTIVEVPIPLGDRLVPLSSESYTIVFSLATNPGEIDAILNPENIIIDPLALIEIQNHIL